MALDSECVVLRNDNQGLYLNSYPTHLSSLSGISLYIYIYMYIYAHIYIYIYICIYICAHMKTSSKPIHPLFFLFVITGKKGLVKDTRKRTKRELGGANTARGVRAVGDEGKSWRISVFLFSFTRLLLLLQ